MDEYPESKIAEENDLSRDTTIITHDDKFHFDEIFGVFLLQLLYTNTKVIRTRDKSIIARSNNCNRFILDVGGVNDPADGRFDHHQDSCTDRWNKDSVTSLSTAGLVWRAFGKQIIHRIVFDLVFDPEEADIDAIFQLFYINYVEAIDCRDNRVQITEAPLFIDNTGLGETVSLMNADDFSKNDVNFNDALALVTKISTVHLKATINGYIKKKHDRELLREAIVVLNEYDNNAMVRVLYTTRYVKDHSAIINDLEKQLHCIMQALFYVFFDPVKHRYILRTIVSNGEKQARVNIAPKKNAVDRLGEDRIVFHNGWIVGLTSLDAAMELATLSVELGEGSLIVEL